MNKLARLLQPRPRQYASYADALTACGEGYEAGALVDVVREKTRRYRDRLELSPLAPDAAEQRLLLALTLSGASSVVDFGGACGAHFFLARRALGDRFRWHVIETPAMAAQGVQAGGLHFRSDLDGITPDLVYSSGALQYVPDPLATLAALTSTGAPHLFLTRLELSEGATRVTTQQSTLSANGPGPMPEGLRDGTARYPVTHLSREALEAGISERYSIRMSFDEGSGMRGYYAVSR